MTIIELFLKVREVKHLFVVLLYTSHYCKCFTNTNLLNPPNNPKYLCFHRRMVEMLLLNVHLFFSS